jgi:hypothetical protein
MALVLSGLLPGAASAGETVVVGTDPAGDWGIEEVGPVGTTVGQDLVEASVSRPDEATVEFVIGLEELPQVDPTLAGFYVWNFRLDGDARTLVSCGNFVGDCAERDNFLLYGGCKLQAHDVVNLVEESECTYQEELEAVYDSEAATISIRATLDRLGVSPGAVLRMKKGWVWAATYVFVYGGIWSEDFDYEYTLNTDWMRTTSNVAV